nr:hypothetical protein [uncultured Campylobacter sp.]
MIAIDVKLNACRFNRVNRLKFRKSRPRIAKVCRMPFSANFSRGAPNLAINLYLSPA